MRPVRWGSRLAILLLLCCPIVVSGRSQSAQRVGFLAVTVTNGGDQGPAVSAFVFVRGYRDGYLGESSMALKPTHDGFFETELPPGLYDVFVSDETSLPMCKRAKIVAGEIEHYTANLKIDSEHLIAN